MVPEDEHVTALVIIFYFCFGFLVYIYALYPLACALLAAAVNRSPRSGPLEPTVSILIAAYNEAAHIEETIKNKLVLDYPPDKIEIIVVSDGSDDGTDSIVNGFGGEQVHLIRQEPRAGKTSALNLAVPRIRNEVIVFSDANSIYAKDALRRLVEPFTDPEVGYVTGRMVYNALDGSVTGTGCSTYMRYENALRVWETRIGSIVGVDGGIDAVRSGLYGLMRSDQLPDLVLPLSVREKGYRIVYAHNALLYENALADTRDELSMRVRVCLRAWHALKDKAALLNPFRFGLFAWQLFSHKVLRYLAPLFQVGVLLTNIPLAVVSPFWRFVLFGQSIFYVLAFLGYILQDKQLPRLITFSYYLCLVNLAAAVALWHFLNGHRQVMWTPRT